MHLYEKMHVSTLEIHEATGADCVLYLKSPGVAEYVYKSAGVNFDLVMNL